MFHFCYMLEDALYLMILRFQLFIDFFDEKIVSFSDFIIFKFTVQLKRYSNLLPNKV